MHKLMSDVFKNSYNILLRKLLIMDKEDAALALCNLQCE